MRWPLTIFSRKCARFAAHPERLGWQVLLVLVVWLYACALHWDNDGLWYQGDSPRHASNGLFWKSYLASPSLDPKAFALRYYARYPAISLLHYPPGFYLLEALSFAVLGPSPHVAKSLVLVFALLAALYSLAWLRRWLTPEAGWAAAALLLLPGLLRWSHAVMLNVPALALNLAALYHARRALETPSAGTLSRHWYAAAALCLASVLTYYPAAVVVPVILAWCVVTGRLRALHWPRIVLLGLLCVVPLVPLIYMTAHWAPAQVSLAIPRLGRTLRLETWTYYPRNFQDLSPSWLVVLAGAGMIAGLLGSRWRRETVLLTVWAAVCYVAYTLIVAREPRYLLLVSAPLLYLAVLALVMAVEWADAVMKFRPEIRRGSVPALIGAVLAVQVWLAPSVRVPAVRGFDTVAAFVEQVAPEEPVLYEGYHDGVFIFYTQARDPRYHRRVVLVEKLMRTEGMGGNSPEERQDVSPEEVVDLLRTRGGCRWLVVEEGQRSRSSSTGELLRKAVKGPLFRLARSLSVSGHGVERVDVYQLLIPAREDDKSSARPRPGVMDNLTEWSPSPCPDFCPADSPRYVAIAPPFSRPGLRRGR